MAAKKPEAMKDEAGKGLPEKKTKAKVLVVDDHQIVRQGLMLLINQASDLETCGEADNAVDALKTIDAKSPDIAIVDISLKDTNGIELIKDIRIRHPKLLVLVLSMHDEMFYAERVLRAGARGYVTKDDASEKVIVAIRKVLSGEIYLSERMSARMLSKFVAGPGDTGGLPAERLSDRELEVFELLGQGMGTSQIADRLHLSIKTIESHRENIKRKLKLENATELLQHAIQWVQSGRGT